MNGTNEVVVRAVGLTSGYGGTPAIHEVDLEVRCGEVATLLGANGAGKTTTLLALAGELPAMRGEVHLLGATKRQRLDWRSRHGLGYLMEGRSVFMQLTGWQNLRLGRGEASRALEHFPELEQHLDKPAGLLSGGQQQMLALARILADDPKVILADEVSLGLAPLIVERLLDALREAANRGTAVLLVEQHIRHALAISDKGYVLRRGRVALAGTGDEFRSGADEIAEHYISGAV